MVERSVLVGLVLVVTSLGIFIWQLNVGASLDYARSAAITTVVVVVEIDKLIRRRVR